jgi:release factor glutamine methyltransferase
MAPAADPTSVRAQLAKTRAELQAARIPYAWLDAEILLAHVLNSSRVRLHTHPEERLTAPQRRRLQSLTHRRGERVPIPYLTGQREFYGYELKVTPAVLIPRPESELLVDLAIQWLKRHPAARRVIDLGTGSGAVAIAVAKAVPAVRVEAIDVSARALRVAAVNVSRHRLRTRITTVKGDLLRGARPSDLIIANLPYISERQKRVRPRELDYEPALALDGGADGLALIRSAVAQAPAVLRPGGALLLECDPSQARRLVRLSGKQWPAANVSVHKDLAGRDRVIRVETVP